MAPLLPTKIETETPPNMYPPCPAAPITRNGLFEGQRWTKQILNFERVTLPLVVVMWKLFRSLPALTAKHPNNTRFFVKFQTILSALCPRRTVSGNTKCGAEDWGTPPRHGFNIFAILPSGLLGPRKRTTYQHICLRRRQHLCERSAQQQQKCQAGHRKRWKGVEPVIARGTNGARPRRHTGYRGHLACVRHILVYGGLEHRHYIHAIRLPVEKWFRATTKVRSYVAELAGCGRHSRPEIPDASLWSATDNDIGKEQGTEGGIGHRCPGHHDFNDLNVQKEALDISLKKWTSLQKWTAQRPEKTILEARFQELGCRRKSNARSQGNTKDVGQPAVEVACKLVIHSQDVQACKGLKNPRRQSTQGVVPDVSGGGRKSKLARKQWLMLSNLPVAMHLTSRTAEEAGPHIDTLRILSNSFFIGCTFAGYEAQTRAGRSGNCWDAFPQLWNTNTFESQCLQLSYDKIGAALKPTYHARMATVQHIRIPHGVHGKGDSNQMRRPGSKSRFLQPWPTHRRRRLVVDSKSPSGRVVRALSAKNLREESIVTYGRNRPACFLPGSPTVHAAHSINVIPFKSVLRGPKSWRCWG